MAKHKKRVHAAKPASNVPSDEARDIAATRDALAPVVKAGISHWRIASAAGTHPLDMAGFLEGRVTLTWELRKRLRDQIPGLLEKKLL